MSDRHIEPGSDTDLAIERALESAKLRAGDSQGTSATHVAPDREFSAAEAGDLGGAVDGD